MTTNGYFPAADTAPAERAVLGAILKMGVAGEETPAFVWEALEVAHFSLTDHGTIYRRMQALHKRGAPVDYVSLYEELQAHREGQITLTQLIDLAEGVPEFSERQWKYHIDQLREFARRRRLEHIGHTLMLGATDASTDLDTLAGEYQERLAAVQLDQTGDLPESLGNAWGQECSVNYVVEGLIAEQSITMVSGEAGDGKSMLAMALASAVAQGLPFLGRVTSKREVLYLDREMPLYVVKQRIELLKIPNLFPHMRIWGGWEPIEPPGPESPQLLGYVRRTRPFLLFDPLVRNLGGADENDASQVRHRMTYFRKLAEAGATIFIGHHRSEKSEANYRGSSDLRASVDNAWCLSRDDCSGGGDPLKKLMLTPYKLRAGSSPAIRFEFDNGTFHTLDAPPRPAEEIILELVRCYPGSTQKELCKLAAPHGVGRDRVRAQLEQAILNRKVETRKSRSNTYRHYLPVTLLSQAGSGS